MPSNLRYSAARTSTISKRDIFKSPTKNNKSPLKNLLPSQAKYKHNLKDKPPNGSPENGSPKKSKESKLTIEDYNVELDYQLSKKHDILTAINTILDNWWSESSSLHNKYATQDDITNKSMEQMVFQLKGLGMGVKAEIMKYRMNQLSQGLVTTNQLYSVFEQEGHTFVDRNIELAIRKGQIKKFVITNASPIILTSHNNIQNGKITYGYENVEVIVKGSSYLEVMNQTLKKLNDQNQLQVLRKFQEFVIENPTMLFMTNEDGFTDRELSILVDLGFVTLTSNHMNEIECLQYAIAFPNCGTFLKLINNGRSWVVKTLSKHKFKEMLEPDLFDRWEGNDINGDSKMTNFRKPFYGFDLNWILADALGSGIIEVFNTPVGRGWKLTGKR